MGSYYVYIVSNRHRTVFYTGMTNNLQRRAVEHKSGTGSRFTSQYRVCDLLYFEEHRQATDAIAREKEIKRWRREKKLALIRTQNPDLVDLAADLNY
ncbi:MAG: GIY-YIG nuclease family protein [Bacteroidota bacterium]